MALNPISLGVRSNVGRANAISAALLANCYPEDAGEEGKIRFPIVACDGFSRFDDTIAGEGTGGIRAGLELTSSALYVVSGTRIVKFNAAGAHTLIAGTISGSGMVTMARNRKEPDADIGIVTSDGNFYTLTADILTNQSSLITSLSSGGTLNSIAAIDGYFVLFFSNGEFFITSIDDGDTIDPLEFAKAESNPDGGMRVAVRGRDLLFFGPKSIEGYDNTGAADFPFERSGAANIGCYAAGSVVPLTAVIDGRTVDTVIWAATNSDGAYSGVMVMSEGLSGQKISTLEIDRAIEAVTDPTTIRAFTWSKGGHTFYTITDLSTFTYSFDTTQSFWPHRRTSSGLDFWRIGMAVNFGSGGSSNIGKVIVGDYTSAKLYKLDSALYDASNASTLTLKHSNNNGNSWLVTRTAKTISGSSNLTQRIKFNRLGQSKEDGKVFNIVITRAVMEDTVANSMTIQPPAVHAWPRRMRFFKMHIDVVPGSSQTSTAKAVTGLAVDAVTLAA